MKRYILLGAGAACACIVAVTLLAGCTSPEVGSQDTIAILSYNVQNLFDGESTGLEYEEYDPAISDWDNEKYQLRLRRLAQVLLQSASAPPDIILLQEIEHMGVLEDLWKGYLAREGYEFFIASDTPATVELGIISRITPTSLRVHQTEFDKSVVRPIVEARFSYDWGELIVFNNHWKSKLPSPEESEPLRIGMAKTLVWHIEKALVENPECAIVVGGDFNERHNENTFVSYETALSLEGGGGVVELCAVPEEPSLGVVSAQSNLLYSPWFTMKEQGTYSYQGLWETIDQFMLSSALVDGYGVEYANCQVLQPSFLLAQAGTPQKWNINTLQGYSDHLPLLLELHVPDVSDVSVAPDVSEVPNMHATTPTVSHVPQISGVPDLHATTSAVLETREAPDAKK